MYRLKIENITSNKLFVGQFDTEQELRDWYQSCLAKKSFGIGEVRAGEIEDLTLERQEEDAVKKKQAQIVFGNKMVALISVMAEDLEPNDSIILIQKYNHILSYLQYGFLDTASMEIAKVTYNDDNGIEARLKTRLLKEISSYLIG